jgi:triacylglycerol lipase
MAFEFEYNLPGFDQDNAYYLVKACEASYLTGERLTQTATEILELKADTFKPFHVVDEEEELVDYHGFIGSTDKLTALIFRGSESLDKWLADDVIAQKPGYGGQVHTGFSDAVEAIWGSVESVLEDQDSEHGLWLAGHGIGGALAVLVAARLDKEDIEVNAVYTFGSPRVGNLDFYYNYAVPTYRVVYNNDVQAHVPAETVSVRGYNYYTYKHVGTLRYFDRHKQLGEGTSNWAIKKALVQQRLMQVGQPPSAWFDDHHISNYVELFTPPEEEE